MTDHLPNVPTGEDRSWLDHQLGQTESAYVTSIYNQSAAPIILIFGNARIVDLEHSMTPRERFEQLKAEWLRGVQYTSSLSKIVEHPAYQRIIQLGKNPATKNAIVSLILADLKTEPKPWFVALHEITGADPIPQSAAGHMRKMVAAWVKWGRANGH